MDETTIKKLNQLNQDFYNTISDEFSETRQQPWDGWSRLVPYLKENFLLTSRLVLDIGCGNGRFGLFLQSQFPTSDFTYHGMDTNSRLVHLAGAAIEKVITHYGVFQYDIVEQTPMANPDLTVLFGVLHHIPSKALRIQRIRELGKQLNPGGKLIFTAWQFDQLPNIFNRRKSPKEVGLEGIDLEENDFLLDWERGAHAVRYCHLTKQSEIDEIVALSELNFVTQFAADGKNGTTNEYVVLSYR